MRVCPQQDVVGVFEINRQDVRQIRHQARTTHAWRCWLGDDAVSVENRLPVGGFRHNTVPAENEETK